MLIASGYDLRRIDGRPAMSMTNDGITWSEPVIPFSGNGNAIGLVSGSDRLMGISDSGLAISSIDDGLTWDSAPLADGWYSPRAICHGIVAPSTDIYMASGQRKFLEADGPYLPMDETAQIFRNMTGNVWDWEVIYSHWPAGSHFYGMRAIEHGGLTLWLACGSEGHTPLVMYSIDFGVSWSRMVLPVGGGFNRALDAASTGDRLWISCDNTIISAPLDEVRTESPTWDAAPFVSPTYGSGDFCKIATNIYGHVVAAASCGLYYTTDQISWTLFSQPGYRFRSIAWWHGQWFAGVDTNLMRYTVWRSANTIDWIPDNNLVYGYDFAAAD